MSSPPACPIESLRLDKQLCHRLYVVTNALTRAYRPFLEAIGLTYPQLVVMMALWEEQHVDISHLQHKTAIDAGALTLILKKLQAKDLIQTHSCPEDKRRKRVQLTPAGEALKHKALSVPNRLGCHHISLTPQELQELARMMDVCRNDLKDA